MTKELWELWLESEERRNRDFNQYLKSKKITKETETPALVKGHIEKADHNLKFLQATLGLKEFNDWAIVVSYYSIYQASLALCALKGYSTKNHLATLLIFIKDFYKIKLDREDIAIVSKVAIEKEEVLDYIKNKAKRKEANYSTKIFFDIKEAEGLQRKAINFVNKVKEIIDTY